MNAWKVEINAGRNENNPKAALDALRLYGGDIRLRDEAGNLLFRQSEDSFYGSRDAYRTLNAFLIPGIENEFSRIEKEGKQLKTIFAEQLEETIRLYCRIFRLMCLCRDNRKKNGEGIAVEQADRKRDGEEIIAKRVERISSLAMLKDGHTHSFFSASMAGFQEEFAQKDGIILLEVHIPPDVPYLDFEKVLGKEYQAIDEREVLLPPFAAITVWEEKLLSAERKIRDRNKKPPLGKYRIDVDKFSDFLPEPEGYALAGQMEKEILAERETAINAIKIIKSEKMGAGFFGLLSVEKKTPGLSALSFPGYVDRHR